MTAPPTLTVEVFWRWLKSHHDCIIRAGGPGCTLFDHPDLHWHMTEETDGLHVVQLKRGKELLSELVFHPEDFLYVQVTQDAGGESENTTFDCVGELPDGPGSVVYFLMAHPFEDENATTTRWTH